MAIVVRFEHTENTRYVDELIRQSILKMSSHGLEVGSVIHSVCQPHSTSANCSVELLLVKIQHQLFHVVDFTIEILSLTFRL